MRIVSLLASGTEIVCALGAGDSLVGRSHECDNPEWVKSLPRCSEPAFDATVPSKAIDAEVGRRIRAGEPLYVIHTELIRELNPDVIIAQEHCEVCAVTPGDVDQSCTIHGARVVSLMASTLDDVFGGIAKIASAIDVEDRGRALVECERKRLDAVRARVAGKRRPSVVVLEWVDPAYAMGNWGPELVEAAGGQLVLGHPGELSFGMASEKVREADPEYLIIAPCGFDLDRTIREAAVLKDHAWWRELRAVREGKVALADGNMFFNRSGMTVTPTAEMIAEILHGENFGTAMQGARWVWL
ncbi:MAG: ABC transporter substrate-binding protein [Acidobacteriia bacterium]|nr:ABC transporter substrate-binding protein [Terriglobia bacterium]